MIKRLWTLFSWGISIYTINNQLKAASRAKDELYQTLAPEQQAEWDKVFGKPGAAVNLPNPVPPAIVTTQPITSPLTQIQAGT